MAIHEQQAAASAATVTTEQAAWWSKWWERAQGHGPTRTALGITAALIVLIAVSLSGRLGGIDLLLPLGIASMVVLAYANGANDVSKAIATLVGSGVTNYRRAIAWGAACTALGALSSSVVASALIGTFTKGFIAPQARQTEDFALAILVGAILWVALSSSTGLPVSTTHAITGALVMVGVFAFGAGEVQWSGVLQKVVIPLLLSPFVALLLAVLAYVIVRPTLATRSPRVMNALHWVSSGTVSFARGLNDTPKIVALGVAFFLITRHTAKFEAPYWLFVVVAVSMGVGSFLGGLAVTKTLAEKVTTMDHTDGFSANIVTALLVAVASNLGLPVSTTHVSSGAIIGIGLREGTASVNWSMVREMALAWLVTVPGAGLLGLAAYVVFRLLNGGG
jgi:PiT family inorganic phosphate transporter